jgi:hypothetical protein
VPFVIEGARSAGIYPGTHREVVRTGQQSPFGGDIQKEAVLNSSLIGKIEKAKRYAKEPRRFHFTSLTVQVEGDNDAHDVTLQNGRWSCPCDFFAGWGVCSHTMAIERLLDGMLPKQAMGQEFAQTAR